MKPLQIITRLFVGSTALLMMATVHAHASTLRLAFLSGANEVRQPSPDAFDGRWTFTSAGCTNTGSIGAVIKHGQIIVRGGGGHVDPDGTLHSVGAGGGLTLTAEGHLDGETAQAHSTDRTAPPAPGSGSSDTSASIVVQNEDLAALLGSAGQFPRAG